MTEHPSERDDPQGSALDPSDARPPYVAAALLCDRVLLEKDDVASLIRVVDQFRGSPRPVDLPEDEPYSVRIEPRLFLSFKAGSYRGSAKVGIDHVPPDGEPRVAEAQDVEFTDSAPGVLIVATIRLETDQPGWHRLDVRVNGPVVTTIPFLIEVPLVEDEAEDVDQ